MKKQKNKADQENVCWSAEALFVLIFTVVPLFVENRYFNIVNAKAHALTVICIVGDICAVAALICDRKSFALKYRLTLLDIGVLALSVSAGLACLFSAQSVEAFWGLQGWGIGGFILISLSVCYFFLSRNLHLSRRLLIPIYVVSGLILIVSIIHATGTDLFYLHSGIYQPQFYYYKSTLGNVNAHVGYLCLLLPVSWLLFADAKGKTESILGMAMVILLLGDAALCFSDGFYLGFGLCVPFAIPYICAEIQRIRRTLLMIGVYGLWLCAAHTPLFAKNALMANDISAFMLTGPAMAAILTVGFGSYALVRCCPKLLSADKTRKIIQWATLSAMAALILTLLVHTVMHYSDDWGTGRARIWRVSMEYFASLDWRGKIFGIGPELLAQVYADKIVWDVPIFVAHSEPVQLLLGMGIFGVTAWVLILTGAATECIRNKLWKKPEIVVFLPLVAYLGQSLVNSATGTNIGMFFGMLACYRMAGQKRGELYFQSK